MSNNLKRPMKSKRLGHRIHLFGLDHCRSNDLLRLVVSPCSRTVPMRVKLLPSLMSSTKTEFSLTVPVQMWSDKSTGSRTCTWLPSRSLSHSLPIPKLSGKPRKMRRSWKVGRIWMVKAYGNEGQTTRLKRFWSVQADEGQERLQQNSCYLRSSLFPFHCQVHFVLTYPDAHLRTLETVFLILNTYYYTGKEFHAQLRYAKKTNCSTCLIAKLWKCRA